MMAVKSDETQRVDALKQTVEEVCVELASLGEESLFMSINLKQRSCFYLGSEPGKEFLTKRMDIIENFYHYINTNYPLGMIETASGQMSPQKTPSHDACVSTVENEFTFAEKVDEEESVNMEDEYQEDPDYVPMEKSVEKRRRPRTYRTSFSNYGGTGDPHKPQVILDMERMIMKKEDNDGESEQGQMSDADSERSESKIEKIVTSDIEYVKSLRNKQKAILICADCGVVCSWKRSMLTHLTKCKKRKNRSDEKEDEYTESNPDSTQVTAGPSSGGTPSLQSESSENIADQSEKKDQRTEIVIQLVAEDGQQVARLQKATVGEDGEITLTVLPDEEDSGAVEGAINPLEQAVKIITDPGEMPSEGQPQSSNQQIQNVAGEQSTDDGMMVDEEPTTVLNEMPNIRVAYAPQVLAINNMTKASTSEAGGMLELATVCNVAEAPVVTSDFAETTESHCEQPKTTPTEVTASEARPLQEASPVQEDSPVQDTEDGSKEETSNTDQSIQDVPHLENVQEPTQLENVQEPTQLENVQEPTQLENVQEPKCSKDSDEHCESKEENKEMISTAAPQTEKDDAIPMETAESEEVDAMETDGSTMDPPEAEKSTEGDGVKDSVAESKDNEEATEARDEEEVTEENENRMVENVEEGKRSAETKAKDKTQKRQERSEPVASTGDDEEDDEDSEEPEIMTALTLRSTKKKEVEKKQEKKGKKAQEAQQVIFTSRSKRQVKASKRYEDFISTPIKIKTEIKTEMEDSDTPRATRSKVSSTPGSRGSKKTDTESKEVNKSKKRKAEVTETPKTRSRKSTDQSKEDAETSSPAPKRMRGEKPTPSKTSEKSTEEGDESEIPEGSETPDVSETPIVRKRGRPPKSAKKEEPKIKVEVMEDCDQDQEEEAMEEEEAEDSDPPVEEFDDSDDWSEEKEVKKSKAKKSTPKTRRRSKRVKKVPLDENRYKITIDDINEAVNKGEEKGKYVCKECGLVCNWKRSFMKHLEKHRLVNEGIVGNYKCTECKKEFVSEWEMKNHMRGKHKMLNVFNCDTCPMSFHTGVQFKQHKKKCNSANPFTPDKDADQKPFICNFCLFKFKTQEQLDTHKELHEIMEYRCDECGKVFPESYRLKNHKRDAHDKSAEFPCDTCSKVFTSARYLHRHRVCVHKKSDSICRSCGKLFPTKEELRLHFKLEHEVTDSLACPLCKEKFTDLKELEAHRPVHYAFQCETCGKKFQKLVKLREHLATHTGEYKYYCDICKKGFLHQSSLEQHLATHTEKKLHMCDTCGMTFKNGSVLKNHLKVHSDTIDFPCKFCETAYRTAEGLKIHMLENHMTEEQIRACNMEVYKCEFCNKFMGRKQHYERHRNQHLGNKKYRCSECPMAFYSQYHLNRHYRSHTCDMAVRRRIRRPHLKPGASATKTSGSDLREEEIEEQEIRTEEETVYISNVSEEQQNQVQTISYNISQGEGDEQIMEFVVINVPQENVSDVTDVASVANISTVTAADESDVVQSILNLQDGIING